MKLLLLFLLLLNLESCESAPALTFAGIMIGAISAAGLFVYLFFGWLNRTSKEKKVVSYILTEEEAKAAEEMDLLVEGQEYTVAMFGGTEIIRTTGIKTKEGVIFNPYCQRLARETGEYISCIFNLKGGSVI